MKPINNQSPWASYLLLISFFLGYSISSVSSQKIGFEKIPSDLGLSQNYISSLYQDSQGFIWVGTRDGLNRFDGYTFRVYEHNGYDTTSISGNYIKWIFEDSQYRMWVGTTTGLNLFDREKEIFYRILPPKKEFNPSAPILKEHEGISHQNISHIMEDANGNIWVGTLHGGLNKISIPSGYDRIDEATFTVFSAFGSEGLWDNLIRISVPDQSGNIWVNTEGNLTKIIPTKGKAEYTIQRFHWSDFNPDWGMHQASDFNHIHYGKEMVDYGFHSIFQDDQSNLWIKAAGGFAKLVSDDQSFQFYPLDFPLEKYKNPPLKGANGAGLIDDNGHLWMAGANNLLIYDTLTHQIIARNHNEEPPEMSVSGISYNKLLKDKSGIIWLGTGGNGLYTHNPHPAKFEYNRSKKWKTSSVRSICEASDGTIWYSSSNLRLYKIKPNTKEPETIILDDRWVRTFEEEFDYVRKIKEGPNGHLWLACDRGLFKLIVSDGELLDWKHFRFPRPDRPSENCSILDVHISEDGDLWLMTQFEFGRFDEHTGQFDGKDYLSTYKGTRLEVNLPTIFQHATHIFYLGTASGMLKYDTEKDIFSLYQNDPVDKNSLSHNQIKCIIHDPVKGSDFLWIATGGGGLNYFDIQNETFTHFDKKSGLPDNVIYSILPEGKENLWLSTNKGISKFSLKNKQVRNYTKQDGLQENEFNSNAYFKSNKGKLYFGGIEGFNIFYPEDIQDNPFKPTVVITSLLIANKKIDHASSPKILSKPISESDQIKLTHKEKVFSFEFAALDYTNTKRNQYAYKLDGFDPDWQYVGTQNKATFTNIDPGNYTLQIKATNSDGVWSDGIKELAINIKSVWWQTWWAKLTFGSMAIALMYYLYRSQISKTKSIEQIKNLEEIDALKTRLFTNVTHEFRTPLTVILGMAENIKNHDNEVSLIRRNSKNLLTLVNELLDLSKIDAGKAKLKLIHSNIIPYLKYLSESFLSLAQDKNISLTFYTEVDSVMMDYDEAKIQHIIYNLLSNAIRFTDENGKIIFHVTIIRHESSEKLLVKVKDSGIGIAPDQAHLIFDRFYQLKQEPKGINGQASSYPSEGTGIGLALTKELVEMMDGTIDLESTLGVGSTFIVSLPMAQKVKEIEQKSYKSFKPNAQKKVEVQDADMPKDENIPLILIVEDNKDVSLYISKILENNYRLIISKNGDEGLQAALNQVPDLIISDVMMPVKDGLVMTQELKENEVTCHIPIILLTAKTTVKNKVDGLKVGADAYLIKPFEKEELLVRIEKLLELRQTLQKKFFNPSAPNATPKIRSKDDQFMYNIDELIRQQIENPDLNVSMIANKTGLSEPQIYRKMKALTGLTPLKYLRKVRLNKAMELLKAGDLNVSEVAYAVGYNDPAYFGRIFRQEFKKPPSTIKK